MNRSLGIARCGLACCLCAANGECGGCNSETCRGVSWCENRRCSLEKQIGHCFECEEECRKGLLSKVKPYGFTLFARRYGEAELLDVAFQLLALGGQAARVITPRATCAW